MTKRMTLDRTALTLTTAYGLTTFPLVIRRDSTLTGRDLGEEGGHLIR